MLLAPLEPLAQLEGLLSERASLGEQLRLAPPSMARELMALAQKWERMLCGLQNTLVQLSHLPANELAFDHLSFTASGMVAELEESTLNRLLDLARDKSLEAIRVKVNAGSTVIEGSLATGENPFSWREAWPLTATKGWFTRKSAAEGPGF